MTCQHCANSTAHALAFGLRASIYRQALELIAEIKLLDATISPDTAACLNKWLLGAVAIAETALAEAERAAPLLEDGTPDPRGPRPL